MTTAEQLINQGIQQGIEWEKLEIAKNMLSKGYQADSVIDLTGLSKEGLEKVSKEMQSSNPNKLLTTRILDHHGKIGPFFFKEFLFVFLGCLSLFFMVLIVSLFIEVKGYLLILIPGSFLALVAAIRSLFTKKITSPWYLHKWISYRFLRPKHIIADHFQNKKPASTTPT